MDRLEQKVEKLNETKNILGEKLDDMGIAPKENEAKGEKLDETGVAPTEDSSTTDSESTRMDRLEEQVEKLNTTKNLLNKTLEKQLEEAPTAAAATANATTA